MKFFTPSKILFNLENICENNNIKSIINKYYQIDNIKKYNNYILSFTGNQSANIFVKVIQYFSDNTSKTDLLYLNKQLICSNYLLQKISFCIFTDINKEATINFKDINLEIIEEPILFEENTTIKSAKLNKFIDSIGTNFIKSNIKKIYSTVHIAAILDEFSLNCFKEDINIINLDKNYKEVIENSNFDFLLVESAWQGSNLYWKNKISNTSKTIDCDLLKLVNYFKEKNIPTVFWNKEGLINFDSFKLSSSIFDYVFTTDENIINQQIEICNHSNVYLLPFAAQPKIHNSIYKNKYKLGTVAFAGSWYANKHLDRLSDMDIILKPSLEFNIDIFDRNFANKSILKYLNSYWPKEYENNIIGQLPYNLLIHTYKNYNLFLNVNSIHDSDYMVSRRVYEILCCKTPVISSYSSAIDNIFKDHVYISKDYNTTKSLINYILDNNFESRKNAKKSQRYILEYHTYKHRLEYIFKTINLEYKKPSPPFICLLSIVENIADIENLYKNITYQTYNNSHYHIILNSSLKYIFLDKFSNYSNIFIHSFDFNHIDNLLIYNTISDIIINFPTYSNFAIFSPKCFYGSNYIRDYVNLLSFVDTDIIGKNRVCLSIDEDLILSYKTCDESIDSYCNHIYLNTAFISKNIFKNILSSIDLLKDNILSCNDTFKVYSDDEFNFSFSKDLISFISI